MRSGQFGLVLAVALGILGWSFPAAAQQSPRLARVGILSDESTALVTSFEPFALGLRDLGWTEGQNVAFERRYAEGKIEILPSLAAELVALHPDVIFAIGTPATQAAKSATQTIPIVFARTADPIVSALVPSLARPGGNVTGVSDQMVETGAKRLELLSTAVPDAKRVGVLSAADYSAAEPQLREIERVARSLNLELIPMVVRGPDELEPALRAMVEQRAGALIVVPAPIFGQRSQQMADLTAKARLPAIFFVRRFVDMGGLMSYGPNGTEMVRRAASHVDKILKGAKPADIPVEQPTRFELVINLKTAKALGLAIPHSLLLRADEVIE